MFIDTWISLENEFFIHDIRLYEKNNVTNSERKIITRCVIQHSVCDWRQQRKHEKYDTPRDCRPPNKPHPFWKMHIEQKKTDDAECKDHMIG